MGTRLGKPGIVSYLPNPLTGPRPVLPDKPPEPLPTEPAPGVMVVEVAPVPDEVVPALPLVPDAAPEPTAAQSAEGVLGPDNA